MKIETKWSFSLNSGEATTKVGEKDLTSQEYAEKFAGLRVPLMDQMEIPEGWVVVGDFPWEKNKTFLIPVGPDKSPQLPTSIAARVV